MKLVIAALNAKYVHTSLSVRCLYAAVRDLCDCSFKEYTINDSLESIAAELYMTGADVIAFSCYIWNIEIVRKIAEILSIANPGIKIIFGGYEVMYDAKDVLEENPAVDFIAIGEGEIVFRNLISALCENRFPSDVKGIAYRGADGAVLTPPEDASVNLDEVPFVYDESIEEIKDRIIYYESSRGCPYSCTYCLSGDSARVRFKDVEKVKKELKFFIDRQVKLVKFVDRTFNANPKRAREIFKYIIDNSTSTCFHMELAGDLLDRETIELLKNAPRGIMQFEIGVQTTNPRTMRAIDRKIPFDALRSNVAEIIEQGNIHVHLDLIAGLPYEDMESFKSSFNDVMSIRPHVLQLGFLKLLKGSEMRLADSSHEFRYRSCPPYEVISNAYIGYSELLELKRVENVLDKLYNSGSFKKTMDLLLEKYADSYKLFFEISEYMRKMFPSGQSLSKQALFESVYNCFKDMGTELAEALKYDYLLALRAAKRPVWFGEYDRALVEKAYEIFKDENIKRERFPRYYAVPAREIMKHVHAERFSYGVLLFDYRENSVENISNLID